MPWPREEVVWKPPLMGLYKVNFDGATFESLNQAGIGVVIRDEHDLVIAALSQRIPLPSSVSMVEALAARRALTFAKEISIFSVEVEGDSLQVIRAINNKKLDRSGLGHIIHDIKLLGSCMQSCSFLHIGRGGNKLAHSLARRAVLAADTDVWLEELPQDLVDVI